MRDVNYYVNLALSLDIGIYKKEKLVSAVRRLHKAGIEPNVKELASSESAISLKRVGLEQWIEEHKNQADQEQ